MNNVNLSGLSFTFIGEGHVAVQYLVEERIEKAHGQILDLATPGASIYLTGDTMGVEEAKRLKELDAECIQLDVDDFLEWMNDPKAVSLRAFDTMNRMIMGQHAIRIRQICHEVADRGDITVLIDF